MYYTRKEFYTLKGINQLPLYRLRELADQLNKIGNWKNNIKEEESL